MFVFSRWTRVIGINTCSGSPTINSVVLCMTPHVAIHMFEIKACDDSVKFLKLYSKQRKSFILESQNSEWKLNNVHYLQKCMLWVTRCCNFRFFLKKLHTVCIVLPSCCATVPLIFTISFSTEIVRRIRLCNCLYEVKYLVLICWLRMLSQNLLFAQNRFPPKHL